MIRNSDGKNLVHAFKMSEIQERNEYVRSKYLEEFPYGINIV